MPLSRQYCHFTFWITLQISLSAWINTLQWWISPMPIHIRRNILVRADALLTLRNCPSDGMVTNSFHKQSKMYLQSKNHPTAHLLNRKFREKLSVFLARDALLGRCCWTGECLEQIVSWGRKIKILVVSALPELKFSQPAEQLPCLLSRLWKCFKNCLSVGTETIEDQIQK